MKRIELNPRYIELEELFISPLAEEGGFWERALQESPEAVMKEEKSKLDDILRTPYVPVLAANMIDSVSEFYLTVDMPGEL